MSGIATSFVPASLVPELLVRDLGCSLRFWCDACGFAVVYERADEGFAYLDRDGAQIMIEEQGRGRNWITAALDRPLGRGVNFQIAVREVESIAAALAGIGVPLFMPPERKNYRTAAGLVSVRQFLVQDPDGYLVRFSATEHEQQHEYASQTIS